MRTFARTLFRKPEFLRGAPGYAEVAPFHKRTAVVHPDDDTLSFARFVTFSFVPIGYVRCAAVSALLSNFSRPAVMWPLWLRA